MGFYRCCNLKYRHGSNIFQESAYDLPLTDETRQIMPPPLGAVRSDTRWVYKHALFCNPSQRTSHPLCRPFFRCVSESTISLEEPLFAINDTAVDAIIFAMSDEGEVVDELDGVIMKF